LLQQLVDERGFAVIDVGDDGDVAPGVSHETDAKRKGSSIVRYCGGRLLRRTTEEAEGSVRS
jgi:hypothetical protein